MSRNKIEIVDGIGVIYVEKNNVTHRVYIDASDIDIVSLYTWCIDVEGYVRTNTNNMYLHIMLLGKRDNMVVDHENQNKLDNRKFNLRFVSKSTNAINSKHNKNNKTGIKGVFFHKKRNKYIAYLTINKKRINFGYFDDLHSATVARLEGELKYFKELSPQKHLFKDYGVGVE